MKPEFIFEDFTSDYYDKEKIISAFKKHLYEASNYLIEKRNDIMMLGIGDFRDEVMSSLDSIFEDCTYYQKKFEDEDREMQEELFDE